MEKGEIVIYQPNDSITLEVRIEADTVWLNRQQLAVLFDRDVKTIGKHVNNALAQELKDASVVANFATTANDGKTYQVEYYNLDMILSIGYRVKSQRGVDFRKWANKVLKDYIIRGYAINQRIERLEQRVSKTEEKIDFFVRTSLPPVEGVFFDGQIFDAYVFVTGLIKSARKRLVLIDNYIDETVLLMFAKRDTQVTVMIVTKAVTNQLRLDLERYNQQYPMIEVVERMGIHDRFLIVDENVYHIGASLKDLGKKLFAFSKMELSSETIMGII